MKPGVKMIEGDGWYLVSPNNAYFPAILKKRFNVGRESVAVFQVQAGHRSPGKRAYAARKANADG